VLWKLLLGIDDRDEDGHEMQRGYRRWSPLLLAYRVRHRLTGPQRGCSCSRCFHHKRRRVPAREVYNDRVRVAELERRVCLLERRVRAASFESEGF
jgi:hypothetical protein